MCRERKIRITKAKEKQFVYPGVVSKRSHLRGTSQHRHWSKFALAIWFQFSVRSSYHYTSLLPATTEYVVPTFLDACIELDASDHVIRAINHLLWKLRHVMTSPSTTPLRFVHSSRTELNWPEQVDPVTRRVYWSASRLHVVLIGCCETRTVSARLVLNTCIPTQMFTVEFANWSSCAVTVHVP